MRWLQEQRREEGFYWWISRVSMGITMLMSFLRWYTNGCQGCGTAHHHGIVAGERPGRPRVDALRVAGHGHARIAHGRPGRPSVHGVTIADHSHGRTANRDLGQLSGPT
jgi:hypothetical protein